MKTPVLLLLAVTLAAWPGHAQTKRKKSSADADAHLPPKNPMIQMNGPETDTTPHTGLISSDLSGRDLAFLTDAVEAGRAQVAFCKVAKEKAESEQIRAVGDALGGTQSQENSYISRLAAKKGLPLDTGLPFAQQKTATELGSLSGAKFDKEVMEKIIATAQLSVASYEAGMQSSDPEIKSLAERLLPVAKDKLQLANSIFGRSQQPPGKPAFRTGAPTPAAAPAAAGGPAPASTPAAAKPGAKPASPTPAPAGSPATAKAAVKPAATPPPRPEGPKPVPVLNPPPPVASPAGAVSPLPGGAKPAATATPATGKPIASPTPAATPAKK